MLIYQTQVESPAIDHFSKAALVAEWANLLWKVKGSADEARQVFQKNQPWYLESPAFWTSYLRFEIGQPTSGDSEQTHYDQIRHVVDEIFTKSVLPESTIQELALTYMKYLLERGTKDAAKEYMNLDREINGPISVQRLSRTQADPSKAAGLVNGQVGLLLEYAEALPLTMFY